MMKKNNKTGRMTGQEWNEAAAWLSGEETGNEKSARLLLEEDEGLMKKWNDIKMAEPKEIIDIDKAWDRVNRRIESAGNVEKIRRISFMPSLLKIAAMVIVVFGLGWIVFEYAAPEKVTVASAADQRNIGVKLPDGSMVFLNHDSYLTYPESFGRNNRKVKLQGEAFFDIAPNTAKPFTIDAGNARVKVLGTSFNVITDNGNDEVEVYVSTGTVMLSSNDGSRSLTLEPGFIGILSGSKSDSGLNTNENYLSWTTGTLNFDGERLEVVFSDLKRSFNINIIASDPSINDFRLTSLFENQPHDTIVQVICTTFNLHSVKEGETYTLSRR
ncbi:MAG TPA: FecR domain-containing protein [Bacteroidales bacterium]|nr:FecR domain-containing protein [Bacteroidales bacterium]